MNSQSKTRVLFVDDETEMLRLFEHTLQPMAGEWEAVFADSGRAALEMMEANPCQIVVSDLRMPRMSGAVLLKEIRRRYPQTVRLVLSTEEDEAMVLRCIGDTHQYLAKPFNLAALLDTLKRIRLLDQRLNNPDIKTLAGQVNNLPSVPEVFFRILEVMDNPDAPADEIGEIIVIDPSLTAQILKLANSAFFGFSRRVSSATEAIQLLGVSRVRVLVLSMKLFSVFESASQWNVFVQAIWKHSLQVGLAARQIVEAQGGNPLLMEEAFSAGMLHDAGKLILATNFTDTYKTILAEVKSGSKNLLQAETERFQTAHPAVGAYLLGIWGLPSSLLEAVAYHHAPQEAMRNEFCSLTAVHCANGLVNAMGASSAGPPEAFWDMEYLKQLNLTERLPQWQAEFARQSAQRNEPT